MGLGLSLRLNPRKIAITLGAVAVLLALQSLYGEYLLMHVLGADSDSAPARVIDVLSVNIEESIPTWYSSLALFLAASLLGWIALIKLIHREPFRVYWLGLALIFVYLSADEGAALHETASAPLQSAFNTSGFFEFGWLLLGIPLVIVFGLAYFRFWLRLPEPTRRLFALAGVLYVGGAVVIESISANLYSTDGGASFRYLAVATVEESCEMLGVIVLIYALLDYLTRRDARIALQTQSPVPELTPVALRWPLSPRALAIGFLAIVILFNVGLLVWSQAQREDATSASAAAAPYHFYVVVEQLASDGVSITHFPGVFSSDDAHARQTVSALLTGFASVQVLSLPTLGASIAVASDAPVLTHDRIIQLMEWIEETEYIFYDTALVRAMVAMP